MATRTPSPDLWSRVQETLRGQMSPHSYSIWMRDVRLLEVREDEVVLEVPDRFHGNWILEYYRKTLEGAFGQALGRTVAIQVRELEADAPAAPEALELRADAGAEPHGDGPAPPQAGWTGRPNPDKTFTNFVVGACNEFAHAAALAVSDFPGSQHNPLFIYGGTGLGKTHLLHAVGNRIMEQDGGPVVYLTAEQFMNEMINSLRYKRMAEFRDRYRSQVQVLLLDDIQFLSGKDRTQEEFFHTFEALQNSGRQIVITADLLPREIRGLEDRLRTRCEGGLLADLQPPDMETMLAILRTKAEDLQLDLPSDVAQYIAGGVSGNIRELEGMLNRLAAVSAFYHESITVDMVQRRLKHMLTNERQVLAPEQIIQAVARFHNVKSTDIRSASRLKRLVRPRQVAIYLIREHTDLSFPDIGRAIGGRDHSTIQYAYRKVKESIGKDPDLTALVEMIEKNLGH